MAKKVLIVVSSYAPAMVADMHRARQLAWELPALGWDVEILSPDESYQDPAFVEADATAFFCPETLVHYAPAPNFLLSCLIRSSTIGWRALLPLNKVAKRLFAGGAYDLVYFSTAKFNIFLLGWWWLQRHRIPYVLDLHDPIYRERPAYFGGTPRGLKRSLNLWLLKHIEALATTFAAGLVSVSGDYIETIENRHGGRRPLWLIPGRRIVVPFAASERDLHEAESGTRHIGNSKKTPRRIVYVGAGGPVMRKAFATLCHTIRAALNRQVLADEAYRIELHGTMAGWRPGDRKDLLEIAIESGIGHLVTETPGRVSYRRSLELLLQADGALVLGVDDQGYMPSKLYNYVLSGKPLLTVFRAESSASRAMQAEPEFGHLMTFQDNSRDESSGIVTWEKFLQEVTSGARFDRSAALSGYQSREMAMRHAKLFDACVADRPGAP